MPAEQLETPVIGGGKAGGHRRRNLPFQAK
jgi:hypothetical protein